MSALFRKLFEIRPGEGKRAGFMFAYIFLLIASLMIVKPVRNSLFLSQFGAAQLPYVYVLVAVVSASFVTLYSKLARKLRLNRLIAVTTVGSILSIALVWLGLFMNYRAGWFLYAFYIWVAIYGLVITTQFWLLANYVFNAREAKRLFGFIGAGAISGGIVGGYLTNFLAPVLTTRGLLHVAVLFLAVCLVILNVVWKSGAQATYRERLRRQEKQREQQFSGNPLKLLLQSRLVSYTAAIVGVGVVVASLVDYAFSAVASEAIQDPDKLTSFFGRWMSNLSIFSLAIQLFVTSRALNRFGVGIALLFLPIAVMVGATAVILLPALYSVTAMKVAEGGFKQSINKAGIELLGLPVPARLKNQVKSLVDVAVDNFATGLAGLLLLLMTSVLSLGVRSISTILIALCIVWLYLAWQVRREYIESFRNAIAKRTIDPDEITHEVRATVQADDLIDLLRSRNEKHIIFALGFFETMKDERLGTHLESLVEFPSAEVRRRVLRLGRSIPELDLTAQANLLVSIGSPAVRASAIRYLCSRTEDKEQLLRFYLGDDDIKVQAAAVRSAAREWSEDPELRKKVELSELLSSHCDAIASGTDDSGCALEIRAALAQAIGIAPHESLYGCLQKLLSDSWSEVQAEAAIAAGHSRDLRFVEPLVELLVVAHVRRHAREALSEFGDEINELIDSKLTDPQTSIRIRLELPRILAMTGTQAAVNILAEHLDHPSTVMRYQVIRALNKIRTRDPDLKIKSRKLNQQIVDETRHYYHILVVLHGHKRLATDAQDGIGHARDTARKLLIRALTEKLDANLERIFRLLGLKHIPRDMYNAYQGVVSELPDLRANAVELLDLVLEPEMKQAILPLIESRDEAALVQQCRELYGMEVPDEAGCLTELLTGDDDWLRVCALYLVAQLSADSLLPVVTELNSHGNPVVREMADYAKQSLTNSTEIAV